MEDISKFYTVLTPPTMSSFLQPSVHKFDQCLTPRPIKKPVQCLKDRICILFFCHSHSHSHSHSALSNVYPVALESTIEDKHC